jgi:hypothetical protein
LDWGSIPHISTKYKTKGKILTFREIVEKISFSKTQLELDKWYKVLGEMPFWMNPKEK